VLTSSHLVKIHLSREDNPWPADSRIHIKAVRDFHHSINYSMIRGENIDFNIASSILQKNVVILYTKRLFWATLLHLVKTCWFVVYLFKFTFFGHSHLRRCFKLPFFPFTQELRHVSYLWSLINFYCICFWPIGIIFSVTMSVCHNVKKYQNSRKIVLL
jgi:hypothetical protein